MIGKARKSSAVVSMEHVAQMILLIREHKVMLDEDLAALYEVEVKVLNQAVKRNIERFPDDFMFQLTAEEAAPLRSQNVTLKTGRGKHRKYLPYAFTEQGVAMLSSVLHSDRAIHVNIEIVRAFVRLRQMLASNSTSRASSPRWSKSTTLSSGWCSTPSFAPWEAMIGGHTELHRTARANCPSPLAGWQGEGTVYRDLESDRSKEGDYW